LRLRVSVIKENILERIASGMSWKWTLVLNFLAISSTCTWSVTTYVRGVFLSVDPLYMDKMITRDKGWLWVVYLFLWEGDGYTHTTWNCVLYIYMELQGLGARIFYLRRWVKKRNWRRLDYSRTQIGGLCWEIDRERERDKRRSNLLCGVKKKIK
jgi:hypothetical protein